MVLSDQAQFMSYSNSFWRTELDSALGTEALVKRNHESKRMAQDLEDYLKKRAKIESEYSKQLAGLTKCFRPREETGVLEASLSALMEELLVMSQAHESAHEQLLKMALSVKRQREEQTVSRKAIEESLHKAQQSKISNLHKTIQAQKSYVKKSLERDNAELCYNGLTAAQNSVKDLEKLKAKAAKSDDDAQKADTIYKSAVMVLNDSVEHWEKEMTSSCEAIQRLDEERIKVMRRDLWNIVNIDSKLALDIDARCEVIRNVLQKCDVDTEIQAFITSAGTGSVRPAPLEYTHYSRLMSTEPTHHVYDYADATVPPSPGHGNNGGFNMKQMFGTMGRKAKK